MASLKRTRCFAPARLLRATEGFTVVELMVAVLLLGTGMLAVIGTLDGSRELVSLSERKEAAVHVGEQEIESIQSLAYASIALNGTPGTSTDPNDPRFYVSAGPPANYRWNHDSSPPKTESFVTGGTLSAAPTSWSDGRLSGMVHRFVTWVDDPCCAGTQDYKRLTVAVTVDGDRGPKKPIIFSSMVRNGV